ncbi:MAG: alpha/beta hydrolase [Gemmatimonadales bacterium]
MLMTGALLLLVAVAAAWRVSTGRRIERVYRGETSRDANGVVVGAASFTLAGSNGSAILLLHGSGDTPQTLRFVAERLNAAGYTVHAPLLPGHGRSPRDFARVSAASYLTAARHALDTLRSQSAWIGVGGLSMGGALATQLAAESHDVRALVLLAPYFIPPPVVTWAARTAPLWAIVQPHLPARGELSVHDPVARDASYAYGIFPPRALRALVATAALGRAALSRVTVPTLVINSREDNRIPMAVATRSLAVLHAPSERHWVSGCGHVITVDYCKETVAELILTFLARLVQ